MGRGAPQNTLIGGLGEMNITVIGDQQDFEQAIKAARKVDESKTSTNLNAIADAGLLGRLDGVWDTIETALREGYRFGRDLAKGALDMAIEKAEQLIKEAGTRAREIHAALLQKLQTFVKTFITNALARVPTTISIGERNYNITKVTCTQKLVMTGSIKVNITEVFSIASNGELEVAVDYSVETQ
jgi:hypothetical protein